MICKHSDFKNGYIFTRTSTDDDFQKILKTYEKVSCIICNERTRRNFRDGILCTNPPITINKKLADGVFFVNGIY